VEVEDLAFCDRLSGLRPVALNSAETKLVFSGDKIPGAQLFVSNEAEHVARCWSWLKASPTICVLPQDLSLSFSPWLGFETDLTGD